MRTAVKPLGSSALTLQGLPHSPPSAAQEQERSDQGCVGDENHETALDAIRSAGQERASQNGHVEQMGIVVGQGNAA